MPGAGAGKLMENHKTHQESRKKKDLSGRIAKIAFV